MMKLGKKWEIQLVVLACPAFRGQKCKVPRALWKPYITNCTGVAWDLRQTVEKPKCCLDLEAWNWSCDLRANERPKKKLNTYRRTDNATTRPKRPKGWFSKKLKRMWPREIPGLLHQRLTVLNPDFGGVNQKSDSSPYKKLILQLWTLDIYVIKCPTVYKDCSGLRSWVFGK